MAPTNTQIKLPIFLVGYMGAGKSTLGPALAHALQCPFVDLDDAVEAAWGTTIAAGVEQRGELAFRKVEHEVLYKLLPEFKGVMALGGGTPLYYQHMDHIVEAGLVIWLDPPLSTLLERLRAEKSTRPLLANIASEDLPAFVGAHLLERRVVYHRAHVRLAMPQPTANDALTALYSLPGSADK
jgi:shikimate kinase